MPSNDKRGYCQNTATYKNVKCFTTNWAEIQWDISDQRQLRAACVPAHSGQNLSRGVGGGGGGEGGRCDFLYPFIAGSRQISQSIHWIPREQAASKNLCAKKYTHIPGCQKSGAFHTRMKKNGVSHILFVEKRGLIVYLYLAALKKGAILHAHLLCHI